MKSRLMRLLWIVGSSIILCGCGGEEDVIFFSSQVAGTTYEEEVSVSDETDGNKILVYVCGAVEEPGVLELEAEARVVDAIALAGGMTVDADENYLNLASRLSDGEKVYVPTQAEVLEWKAQENQADLININTADKDELCKLSGIGESKAEDIINYREKNGAFQSKEELMKIPGIKESLLEKIADKITIQ